MLLPLRGGYGAQGIGQDATAKITQLPQMTLLPSPKLRYVEYRPRIHALSEEISTREWPNGVNQLFLCPCIVCT